MSREVQISYCGVCCDHCGMKMRIPNMAKELWRFIDAYRYGEWLEYVTRDFNFQNFAKSLQWFAESNCKGCLQGGGMPSCEVRNCCKEKSLRNCYFCKDFKKCKKPGYQKETYRVTDSYERIKQSGYENWLRDQEEKTQANFDNIRFLERKISK